MSKELMAEAILGRDAQDFLKSELGRFLLGMARHERDTAMATLKNVYPWRRRKIQELQNVIWRAEKFEQWMADLIINGKNAERILDGDGETEIGA